MYKEVFEVSVQGDDPIDEKLALVYFRSQDLTKTLIKLKKQIGQSKNDPSSAGRIQRLTHDTANLLIDMKNKLSSDLDELMQRVLESLSEANDPRSS